MPDPAPNPQVPTKWQRRTPNLLTMLRLLLTAAFVIVMRSFHLYGEVPSFSLLPIAAAIFVVAAITDALDGYLARRWNAVSPFGRIMDPFADKVLVLGALIMLGSYTFDGGIVTDFSGVLEFEVALAMFGFAPWMVVVILARELLVTSIRGVYEARGVDFSAGLAGKLKMILQSIAVPLVLILAYLCLIGQISEWVYLWNALFALLVTLVTIWSAVPYVNRAVRMRNALSDKPE